MLLNDTGRRWSAQFNDLTEMATFIKSTPPVWSQTASHGNPADESWDLGAGYDGTERAMLHGWPEGLEAIAADVASVPSSVSYEREYGFAGELPDVPRYLSGDPRCMIHRGKQHKPTSVMSLAVSISCSGGTSARAMQLYGAAMAAIIDRLESRHVRVELTACWISGQVGCSWIVKRAEDPLDLNAIAFSLAHPGAYRRIGFAIMERSPKVHDQPGYGKPRNLPSRDYFTLLPEDCLLIGGIGVNGGDTKCRSMADALAFVEAQVNKAAGEPIAILEAL
jgi:hypothetical protein